MNKKTYFALILAACTASTALFATSVQANTNADKKAVDSACAQDAATANCGNEQVGKGLLKCLHAYQKANSSFQFSDACKAALDTIKADRPAKKHK